MKSTPPAPQRVIDPHIHQWDPYSTPRHTSKHAKLLRPIPRIPRWFGRAVPLADREFVGDPHHVLKPYLPHHYQADAAELGVGTVVHIEAAWTGSGPGASVEETRWVANLPFGSAGAPRLGGIVVRADPRADRLGELLDQHLAASPLVRGVRHSLSNHPDRGVRDFDPAPDTAGTRRFLDGFAAIAERGLSFELWMYSHQLPFARQLIREYPETTFVLDHYATPVGFFGPRGHEPASSAIEHVRRLAKWRDHIAAIGANSNVVAKHSGLGMPLLGAVPGRQVQTVGIGELTDRAAPLIQHLHEVFGPNRTMWASNYPMDKPVHSIAASAKLIVDVLGAEADIPALFHDVAARTYRIKPNLGTIERCHHS